jgi:Zinc dependent phospholipase C
MEREFDAVESNSRFHVRMNMRRSAALRFFSMKIYLSRLLAALLLVSCLFCPTTVSSYSVLTHEAIIDSVWTPRIVPILLAKFPSATPEELRHAKAFAYGGAIIQDMGYYPHGSKFFSDLTHYFRSGDFVQALLRNASTLNDYAFALGALAHYAADNSGHHLATNLAVPMLYPDLEKKYGKVMTYEDNPVAHIKTEFGFDVLEVAKGRYASDNYHDFIGFDLSLPLLEQAFRETYGIDLKTVFQDEVRTANSYRYTVSALMPRATRIAWVLKRDDIQKDLPGITRNKFLYNLSRSEFQKQWGKNYQKPSTGDTFTAFVIRLMPKIGPLRFLQFRTPTPEAEKLFENSFNKTLDQYQQLLNELANGRLLLPNYNFDVGEITARGQYRLTDQTCAELLDRLSPDHYASLSTPLRGELLLFFSESTPPSSRKQSEKARLRMDEQIQQLKSATSVPFSASTLVPAAP